MIGLLWRNGLQLAGAVSVAVGCWMVYPPLAFIAGGVGLIMWERGIADGDTDDS